MRWTDKFRKRITSVEEIAPLAFDHQGNMDNWLITEKIENVKALMGGLSLKIEYHSLCRGGCVCNKKARKVEKYVS